MIVSEQMLKNDLETFDAYARMYMFHKKIVNSEDFMILKQQQTNKKQVEKMFHSLDIYSKKGL